MGHSIGPIWLWTRDIILPGSSKTGEFHQVSGLDESLFEMPHRARMQEKEDHFRNWRNSECQQRNTHFKVNAGADKNLEFLLRVRLAIVVVMKGVKYALGTHIHGVEVFGLHTQN